MTRAQLDAEAEETRQRLRELLAQRCQLKLHRETKRGDVFNLTLARSGSKLQEVKPDSSSPNGLMGGRGFFNAQSVEISALATVLSAFLRRPVLDATGLKGLYTFQLHFDPFALETAGAGAAPAVNRKDPSIFTAVEEQLGLRLQSGTGPVEVLIIDAVEKPSEN